MSSFDQKPLGQFEGQTEVGSVIGSGSGVYNVDQQLYTLAGGGTGIGGDHDNIYFVWKRLAGNFIVTMRAAWLGSNVNPQRLFGWMARTNLDPGSPCVVGRVDADGQPAIQFRRMASG
jgi:hypothetical protein